MDSQEKESISSWNDKLKSPERVDTEAGQDNFRNESGKKSSK